MQPASQPIIIYASPPPQPQGEPAPAAAAPPVPSPQSARQQEEDLPPVILVFRDHRREEITNYAIAGDTLYVLLPRGRRKIALSDLDLPATAKVNDDRGVDFRVP